MSEVTTMTRAAPPQQTRMAEMIEKALIKGDLAALNVEQRVQLVQAVCERERIDWLSRPFDFLTDKKGKVTLYARADCARQLAKRDGITVEIVAREIVDDCCIVHVRATAPAGGKGGHKRTDEDVGVVSLAGLKGEDRANGIMKAITKGKRRAVLSVCGLGLLDETEAETVAQQEPRQVEVRTTQPAALPSPAIPESVPGRPVNASLPLLDSQLESITALKAELQLTGEAWKQKLIGWGVTSAKQMTQDQAGELIRDLKHLVACRALEPQIGGDSLPNNPPPANGTGTGGQPNGTGFRQTAAAK